MKNILINVEKKNPYKLFSQNILSEELFYLERKYTPCKQANLKVSSEIISDNFFSKSQRTVNSTKYSKKFELKSENEMRYKTQFVKMNTNKEFIQNMTKENNKHNNKEIYKNNKFKNKYNFYEYKSSHAIKYLIIYIIFCLFCNINSQNFFRNSKINKIIIFYSYEITLKVKGTGIKNILSFSSSFIYPCPSKIYLNNELVQNIQDCHYINITESDTEIKIGWVNNLIINSTKNLFYNCTEIIEIDMTKFDTSLVTDMSSMFSQCYSLKSLNVSNLITTNVKTMQNMFFKCTNLTSINLESFTIQSTTSLYRMFYGCINLEYINIKNFQEKLNINLDEMFYNIAPNSVICLSACQPPTNFNITSVTATQVKISWTEYNWNNYTISYGLQGLSNPDNANKIIVTNRAYYTLTNLNSDTNYDVYLKTNCGNKSSYWIGPLLISIGSYNLPFSGNYSINTCSKIIYDHGGPKGNSSHRANSILTINPETSGKLVFIKGSGKTESGWDYLYIYNGKGTSLQLGRYDGSFTVPLFISTSGPLTIKYITDGSIESIGFELTVGCIYNPKTIFSLIKSNSCNMLSCVDDWRNIQNKIYTDTGSCVKNCQLTNNKYEYRGKCYNTCPGDTNIVNFMCYSKSVLEKCEQYSIESDYENLCIKCKNNYYPMLNDKSNKNNFINCYKNNSLEKYYLDTNDFLFKLCYKTCKTCSKNGTKENHNCLTCDINYEFNLTIDGYYNCYPKCDNYYYFDADKNFICLNKTECPDDYNNLIEGKKINVLML